MGFPLPPGESYVRLYVVIQFPNVLGTEATAEIPNRGRGAILPGPEGLRERQDEYAFAIARTLIHPAVAEVHVLINDTQPHTAGLTIGTDERLLLHDMGRFCGPAVRRAATKKLRLFDLGRPMVYADAFLYANEFLPTDSVALIMNSDVYPVGPGWFQLGHEHFWSGPQHRRRVGFMLARYCPKCPNGLREKTCHEASKVGSADGFVFKVPVPDSVVKKTNFPTNWWGAENRAGAALLGSAVGVLLNPCKQLALWHSHCSRVRSQGQRMPRVNRGAGHSAYAQWRNRLRDLRPETASPSADAT